MTELAWYETRDQVATVTLDSPRHRNALTMALIGEMTVQITGHFRATWPSRAESPGRPGEASGPSRTAGCAVRR